MVLLQGEERHKEEDAMVTLTAHVSQQYARPTQHRRGSTLNRALLVEAARARPPATSLSPSLPLSATLSPFTKPCLTQDNRGGGTARARRRRHVHVQGCVPRRAYYTGYTVLGPRGATVRRQEHVVRAGVWAGRGMQRSRDSFVPSALYAAGKPGGGATPPPTPPGQQSGNLLLTPPTAAALTRIQCGQPSARRLAAGYRTRKRCRFECFSGTARARTASPIVAPHGHARPGRQAGNQQPRNA